MPLSIWPDLYCVNTFINRNNHDENHKKDHKCKKNPSLVWNLWNRSVEVAVEVFISLACEASWLSNLVISGEAISIKTVSSSHCCCRILCDDPFGGGLWQGYLHKYILTFLRVWDQLRADMRASCVISLKQLLSFVLAFTQHQIWIGVIGVFGVFAQILFIQQFFHYLFCFSHR